MEGGSAVCGILWNGGGIGGGGSYRGGGHGVIDGVAGVAGDGGHGVVDIVANGGESARWGGRPLSLRRLGSRHPGKHQSVWLSPRVKI